MANPLRPTSPVVSIVIPTYNQNPDYLRDAVGSALSQTFRDVEVIVSDNHTTNGALAALQVFDDPRLRIVKPPHHLPIVEHFAFASESACGEFISFLASDDLLYPDWLDNLLPLFAAHPDATFGFGEIEKVPHDAPDHVRYHFRGLAMPTGYYATDRMVTHMMRMDRAAGWMVGDLIRTDAYWRAGGIARDSISYCGDYALSLRLLELGGGAVYLNQPVAKNRTWEAKDGKADARRIQNATSDMAKIFDILDASVPLAAVVAQHAAELKLSRANRARFSALALLTAIAHGEVDAVAIGQTIAEIRKIDDGAPFTQMLLVLCRPEFSGVLRAIHAPALRFAQSRLGQALLKF